MNYVEITADEAIRILQGIKTEKVLVAIQNLKSDSSVSFCLRFKSDCFPMIDNAETISSFRDDFVKQLRLFTEKQDNLLDIKPEGLQSTILYK